MKLWHKILLTIGILMVIGGSLALILTIDTTQYASGEASAMVERVYQWNSNSADLYSDLYEEYLGQGVWEVKSSSTYNGEQAVFRVYETTDTVEIYNDVARTILNRREELEKTLTTRGPIIEPPSTTTPSSTPSSGLGENPFN